MYRLTRLMGLGILGLTLVVGVGVGWLAVQGFRRDRASVRASAQHRLGLDDALDRYEAALRDVAR